MCMKKTAAAAVILFLAVSVLSASAVFVGFGGGRVLNRMISEEDGRRYLGAGGWKAYLPVTVECTDHFGFETGLEMTQKCYRSTSDPDTVDGNLYFTFPLSLRVSTVWVDNVSLFLSLGGYCGWRLGSAGNGKDDEDSVIRNHYTGGATASLGYTVDADSLRFSLSLFGSFDLSDVNREKTDSGPLHNLSFGIASSLQWRTGR